MGTSWSGWRAEIRAALLGTVSRLRQIVEARKPVYNDQGEPIGEVYASQDRDAIQAAKLLTQYGFEGGAGQDSPIFDAHAVVLPEVRTPDGEESVGDLKRTVSAMIEATVQSVNTRPSTSRKRV
jgi:hypothetical protein